MAIETTKPSILDRILRRQPKQERVAWLENGAFQHHNMLDGADAPSRRANRTDMDMVVLSSAIFAAVRRRARAMTRPVISVVEDMPDGTVLERPNHPALLAFKRVNDSLTASQGRGLIETHLLTSGKSFWVKRRNGLGQVVEFEVWPPNSVAILRDRARPWVPVLFKRWTDNGTTETVGAEDMVYIRYLVDPRDPINGIGPIEAARVSIDTGLEALRYNLRFYDNNAAPDRIFTVEEGGPAEVARIEDELERKFKGTDKSHRALVTEGGLKEVGTPLNQKDMEFMEQLGWTVEEVARAFEMSPVLLGDLRHGSFENVEQAMRDFWTVIEDEMTLLLEQFTEFLLQPDFGANLRFVADFTKIPFLQPDKKLRAETDEINLRSGKVVINDLHRRDGEEDVAWGNVPLLPLNIGPLLVGGSPPAAPGRSIVPDRDDMRRGLDRQRAVETSLDEAFGSILKEELNNLLVYLDANAEKRDLRPDMLSDYVWNWRGHEATLAVGLSSLYEASLEASGFAPGGATTPAQELAALYARRRGAEMLVLEGDENIVTFTRERVKRLVAETIETGGSLRELKNNLRKDFSFSSRRASTIARTETAMAQGDAQIRTFESLGTEAKEWRWPGGVPDGVCDVNNGAVVGLTETFPSGHSTVPAHPNCTCSLLPVRQRPS